jgi:D-tagatose-1,6-bisphosphate aldolase subunit GatZ/KbaZ
VTSSPLSDVIIAQKQGIPRGITSICSANPSVLEASFAHAKANGLPLLIESTCNQVNQFGGYTGQTPEQFMVSLGQLAAKYSFPTERLVVGGDHLGPNPWRLEPSAQAMDKSRALVEAYANAGYTKFHIDTSMKCVDDDQQRILPTAVIAKRAAELVRVAEASYLQLGKSGPAPLYVIGTEVPAPGGVDDKEEGPPAVTSTQSAAETIATTRDAFRKHSLDAAWERVIAVVVQPGVEYGNDSLFDYVPKEASALSGFIKEIEGVVFEAHSTDYQTRALLHEMVRDQFAILKVGPALTFAYREAIFALAEIEEKWLTGNKGIVLSNIREKVDNAMLANPKYWQPFYPGNSRQQWVARQFSLSDRIRYYWPVTEVQFALQLLLDNLSAAPVPLPLLSQFLPDQFRAVRDGRLQNEPDALIEDKITAVLDDYAFACGSL